MPEQEFSVFWIFNIKTLKYYKYMYRARVYLHILLVVIILLGKHT